MSVEKAKKMVINSLYDALGGETAVNIAVDIFYSKVLADERINPFFDSIDMDRQHQMQKAFLTMVFGGPSKYSGRDMRSAHKHLNLTEVHFNAVMEHLVATLQELEVPELLIQQVHDTALSVKDDVLNR